MKTKILISGATSFSGSHIAQSLVKSGHEVAGTLTRPRESYENESLIQSRMKYSGIVQWVPEFSNEKTESLDFIRTFKPKVWVAHGAPIKGYRSPDFDFLKSLQETILGTRVAIEVFKENGGELFVHSGTVFEADEGQGELPGMSGSSEAISAYGMSKNLVWHALRFFCSQANLPILKIIIPNPIGRFENRDRLIPFFVEKWKRNEVPEMKSSHLVRDQIPAEWLAQVYQKSIQNFLESHEKNFSVKIKRPSGFVMTNRKFIELCQKEFKSRIKNLSFECAFQSLPTNEPLERFNSEPVSELNDSEARRVFFDHWTESLF
jgi:UDP-glucose 4-epimerase